MDEKKIFLNGEGDAWFLRNKDRLSFEEHKSRGTQFLADFLGRGCFSNFSRRKVLEIGCSSGNNLAYICREYDLEGFGVEPSGQAVQVGNEWAKAHPKVRFHLVKGTGDELPFEDGMFDIVMFGFCLSWTDREYLHRTIAEADRVLKHGGFLLIEDFQVPVAYKRPNKHRQGIFTYKLDYAKLFLSDPCYTLIERTTYSHSGAAFDPEMQERVSVSILYKEYLDDVYIFRE